MCSAHFRPFTFYNIKLLKKSLVPKGNVYFDMRVNLQWSYVQCDIWSESSTTQKVMKHHWELPSAVELTRSYCESKSFQFLLMSRKKKENHIVMETWTYVLLEAREERREILQLSLFKWTAGTVSKKGFWSTRKNQTPIKIPLRQRGMTDVYGENVHMCLLVTVNITKKCQ